MAFNPDTIRLNDLEEQLTTQLTLLKKTEQRMQVTTDDLDKERLRLNAEQVREFYEKTLTEYNELLGRSVSETAPQLQVVAEQLQAMDAKLTAIQVGIVALRQDVLARFDQSEQALLTPLLERLDGEHLANTQALLSALEGLTSSEAERTGALQAAITGFAELQRQADAAQKPLPPALTQAARVVEDPKLEFKHRLKVAIPLIPGLLTYERELGFNVNLNVQAAYERLKRLLPHRAATPHPM